MLSWLEISTSAIHHNISAFSKRIGKGIGIMPVVKSNAYGHGIIQVAQICAKSPLVKRLCVVNSDEALLLINSKINKPIFILSFFSSDESSLSKLIKNNVEFPLYSTHQAKLLNKVGERCNKSINVHLKIDTGTIRVGIFPEEITEFIEKIKGFKFLKIVGLWSHFSSSEEDAEFTKRQYTKFVQAQKTLKGVGINPVQRHMACSAAAGLYRFPELNEIRLGLGLYGLYSTPAMKQRLKLKPVLSWKTRIIQIKNISAGAKVGYGGTYTAPQAMRVAVLPIGYFDGYDRRLSNKGQVIIQGMRCPIIGRICMNLCMADVSLVTNIKEGDEVVIIGSSGKQEITVDQLAQLCQTINYEFVARLSSTLPRMIKK